MEKDEILNCPERPFFPKKILLSNRSSQIPNLSAAMNSYDPNNETQTKCCIYIR